MTLDSRSVDFLSLMRALSRRCGIDPDALGLAEAEAMAEHLSQAARRCWREYDWPDTVLMEQRFIRPVWSASTAYTIGTQVFAESTGSYYQAILAGAGHAVTDTNYWTKIGPFAMALPLVVPGHNPMGEVLGVWDRDPDLDGNPQAASLSLAQEVGYRLTGSDLILDQGAPNGCFIRFRLPPPRFTTIPFSSTINYSAGDLTFYSPNAYVALIACSGSGQSPIGSPDRWRAQMVPTILEDAIKHRAKAEWLGAESQEERASISATMAAEELERATAQLHDHQGQRRHYGVVTRTRPNRPFLPTHRGTSLPFAVGSILSSTNIMADDTIDRSQRGLLHEMYLSSDRLDGADGDGTASNPLNASTPAKMLAIMQSVPEDTRVILCGGVFESLWYADGPALTALGWRLKAGCVIDGQGISTLRLLANSAGGGYNHRITTVNGGADYASVINCTIDANLGNQTANNIICGGVFLGGNYTSIRNNKFINYGVKGSVVELFLCSAGTPSGVLVNSYGQEITNNIIYPPHADDTHNGATCLSYGGFVDAVNFDTSAINNGFGRDLPGYALNGKITGNCVISRTDMEMPEKNTAIQCVGSQNCLIEGNYVFGAAVGLYQDTEPNHGQTIQSNLFVNVADGMAITGSSYYNNLSIIGNTILLNGNFSNNRRGIRIDVDSLSYTGSTQRSQNMTIANNVIDYYGDQDDLDHPGLVGGINISKSYRFAIHHNVIGVGIGSNVAIDVRAANNEDYAIYGNVNKAGAEISGIVDTRCFTGIKTANYTAKTNGEVVIVNTTSTGSTGADALTVHLPNVGTTLGLAEFGMGMEVTIVDAYGTWATHPCIVVTGLDQIVIYPTTAYDGTLVLFNHALVLDGTAGKKRFVTFKYTGNATSGWVRTACGS